MSNYLKAATFESHEDLVAALVAAKLHFDVEKWKGFSHHIFVDESELTVWTEWDDSYIASFWGFWEMSDFSIDIEWSEIELGYYAEDICAQHYTSTAVDGNVEFPQFEFEINFNNTKLDKFLAEQQGEAA